MKNLNEIASKFYDVSTLECYKTEFDNSITYSLKKPRQSGVKIINSKNEEHGLESNDSITITISEDKVQVKDTCVNGWRQYFEQTNDFEVPYSEETVENSLLIEYSIKIINDQKYLVANERSFEYSYGEHDSYGGEKGNGFNNTNYDIIYSVEVPSNFSLLDDFNEKIKIQLENSKEKILSTQMNNFEQDTKTR